MVSYEHHPSPGEKDGDAVARPRARRASGAETAPSNAYVAGPAVRLGGGGHAAHAPGKCAGCAITGGTCQDCGGGRKLDALPRQGHIPSNTVQCLRRWTRCSAPYSPGSWAAKVTYHCPRFIFPGIVLPGTTEPTYVTIPDEYIGTSPTGTDLYRCRRKPKTFTLLMASDTIAATLNRTIIYPNFGSCHAGFRRILGRLLAGAFLPSGGGRPWGGRVSGPTPPSGIPCP